MDDPKLTRRRFLPASAAACLALGLENLTFAPAPAAAGGDHPFTLTGGHTRWGFAHYEPNQVDRDTRVDVEPLAERG